MGYKEIESRFSRNIDQFDLEHVDSFAALFVSEYEYEKHLSKRVALGHVRDTADYAIKTFLALEKSTSSYWEHYKSFDTWDRIIYDASSKWVVIVSEYGKIITSYSMHESIGALISKRQKLSDKISMKGEGDELRTKATAIRNRLEILYKR